MCNASRWTGGRGITWLRQIWCPSSSVTSQKVILPSKWPRFGWKRSFMPGGIVINARAETAHSRPLFRGALASHRCVIPANGFFEWEKAKRQRLPWWFSSTEFPVFGLAGLYAPATDKQPAGFVILTTEPNEIVAPYHNRIPVMVAPASAKAFIKGTASEAAAMLHPYPAESMRAHRVTPAMNKANYEGPDCIAAM